MRMPPRGRVRRVGLTNEVLEMNRGLWILKWLKFRPIALWKRLGRISSHTLSKNVRSFTLEYVLNGSSGIILPRDVKLSAGAIGPCGTSLEQRSYTYLT